MGILKKETFQDRCREKLRQTENVRTEGIKNGCFAKVVELTQGGRIDLFESSLRG